MKRTVWGIGTPRTLRPLWPLAELGLEYEHRKILSRGPGMEDPRFRALSERHKVPFYEDDRVQIGESAAIVGYLADRQVTVPIPHHGLHTTDDAHAGAGKLGDEAVVHALEHGLLVRCVHQGDRGQDRKAL